MARKQNNRLIIHPDNPQKRLIDQSISMLKDGGLLIYPTDTFYGMGCSVYNRKSIEKLYRLKGKSKFESVSLLCNSIQQASQFARIDNMAFRILKRCFPGPYTVILDATKEIPRLMLSRTKEVGIRIPDHPIPNLLIETLGNPLVNTTALLNENEYLENDINPELSSQVDQVLDGGMLTEPGDSTVFRIDQGEIEILREGKGSIDRLLI